jgi:peptide/nickel transport system ATP-binding protein
MLKIQDLTVSFNGIKAINNVSFNVEQGEVLGIVGESGSGKSLCSLAIMNLLPKNCIINQGTVQIENRDTFKNSEELRGKKIGMIFQEPMTSLNPVFTCGEQLEETLINNSKLTKREAKEKSISLFGKVKLSDPKEVYKKYPHELSGGQKQRVMIAIAISCEPQLLIADEPTTALDVTVQKEVLELLIKLQKETGMAMIFITHDLALVSNIANRVVIMHEGQVIETGKVQDVFERSQHAYTKALLSCRPSLKIRNKRLRTVDDFLSLATKQEEVTTDKERRKKHKEIYKEQAVLEVKDLKVSYSKESSWLGSSNKRHVAVNGVNFLLYEGESLGLVGESGCGKTTIGRALVQLIKKEKGEVYYKGTQLSKQNEEEKNQYKKDVQIIFQDPFASLNPRKLIGHAVQEPLEVYKIGKDQADRKKKALDLLLKVGLKKEDYYKYPHEFSGGQRQRISIARTLAVQPKIIICDESVSALDVSIQAQVLNLLNDLKESLGLTFIFISHDLSVVKYFCDRMLVMNKRGEIEEEGETDFMYENPKSAYTRSLIEAIPK